MHRIGKAGIGVVSADAQGKAGIHRAIHIQPADAAATDPGHGIKVPADDDAPDGIHHHRVDRASRSGTGIETGIQRTVGIQTRHRIDIGAIVRGKGTRNDHLPIGLQGKRPNHGIVAIDTQTGIEGGIHRPIRIQTRHVVTIITIERGEITADQNFAIRLKGHGGDKIIGPTVGRHKEGGVLVAIRQRANNAVVSMRVVRNKTPRDERFPIRLLRHGIYRAAIPVKTIAHTTGSARIRNMRRIGTRHIILVPRAIHRTSGLVIE